MRVEPDAAHLRKPATAASAGHFQTGARTRSLNAGTRAVILRQKNARQGLASQGSRAGARPGSFHAGTGAAIQRLSIVILAFASQTRQDARLGRLSAEAIAAQAGWIALQGCALQLPNPHAAAPQAGAAAAVSHAIQAAIAL